MLAHRQMPKEAWANMFSGTVGVVSGIVAILLSGLIFFGAMKMKKLENYGLAMAASIVAMIPCLSPCCLLACDRDSGGGGVVEAEVKSAFR